MTAPVPIPASGQGRVQNLREISVKIYGATLDDLAGTGVAVRNRDGEVVIATCAHVAEEALGKHPRDATDDDHLGVYFRQARTGDVKERRARVTCCLSSDFEDDVVLLTLIGDPAPLTPQQVAVLGSAEESEDNPFKSYGYSPVGGRADYRLKGTILGPTTLPNTNLKVDMIQLDATTGSGFQPGMSGSAVLDTERNLVVGLVSERWRTSDDRAQLGWGLDAQVLTFNPFNLTVQTEPYPRTPSPTPKTDIAEARAAAAPNPGLRLQGAPEPLPEWVGRADMLSVLNDDWRNPLTQVVGLIGFGGEGKSSLARQWLANLLADQTLPQPDGVFWWPFYDRNNIDEFFEAAIVYLGGGLVDPRALPSASTKAHVIGAMLGARRYLFVLDGLEVMQHNEGDQYGQIRSNDLRDLLGYFAGPDHQSFCLITSRAPINDLIADTNYQHRDVERLSEADGRALLRKVGVTGTDDALDVAVNRWDGHALTLGLVGSLLVTEFGGDISQLDELPQPEADETRYARVHRVLRRYDDHLSEAEKAFLMLFSAFRTPVKPDSFEKVFRATTGETSVNAPLVALADAEFAALLQRLQDYRMLRYNDKTDEYTTHPLIRNHYFTLLSHGASAVEAHVDIARYYLETVGHVPYWPNMDDLLPLIEVMHHTCRAGAYDEAYWIFQDRISQRHRYMLTDHLGAYETALTLMLEFFPSGDPTQAPLLSNFMRQSWILHQVGLCLQKLGRLTHAVSFFERGIMLDVMLEDWRNASTSCLQLADLYNLLGALAETVTVSNDALALARRANDEQKEQNALVEKGWIAYQLGKMNAAKARFHQAEALQQKIEPDERFLYGTAALEYAEFLKRASDTEYAYRVTVANVQICTEYHWPHCLSRCHRVLGDLKADAGQHDSARDHYAEALRIARSISILDVLIEILLAQGRWLARHMHDPDGAFNLLNEALSYCTQSGYRILEADCRVALAWAHLRAGSPTPARAEALTAKTSSAQMGYHWGQVDAEEVLAALDAG